MNNLAVVSVVPAHSASASARDDVAIALASGATKLEKLRLVLAPLDREATGKGQPNFVVYIYVISRSLSETYASP
jgi:hypothetical protein